MAEPKTTNLRGAAGRQARQRAQKEQEGDIETLVAELETRVDRLRASYDQYFVGIEKVPPHVQIKDVERRFQELRKIQIRNTALRFKFQTVLQRHNTYQTYWQRIVRQIEEGTYKRDLRRAAERFGPTKRSGGREIEIDVEFDDLMSEDADLDKLLGDARQSSDDHDTLPPAAPNMPAAQALKIPPRNDAHRLLSLDDPGDEFAFASPKQLAPIAAAPLPPRGKGLVPPLAPPAATKPPPVSPAAQAPAVPKRKSSPPPAKEAALAARMQRNSSRPPANAPLKPPPRKPDADLSDARLRQLYSQYIEAKRARQESTAALTYDSLAKTLLDSSAKLKEKHGGKKVDFEVAVKDGKTILRPVVKEK